MKILHINIQNLASLEGETLIDFTTEPLASAGIFAITGPTGAGKSTILDALCLALYGRTPRYVQAGASRGIELQDSSGDMINQGDPRAILRDGSTSGSASVVFVGIDGDIYDATWAVKRAHLKVTGKLGGYTHTLFNKTKNTEISGTRTTIQKEIERLVGLNFDQFTRSVLLAQGDFTAFMKADKEEKSALLEKLTGSQIYSEISKTIYEHYKAEQQIVNDLQAKLSIIEFLNPEQKAALQLEITEKKAQQITLNKEKLDTDQAVTWHKQKAELEIRQTESLQLHKEAEASSMLLASTRQRLAQAQKVRPLKNTLEGIREQQKALEKVTMQHTERSTKFEQLTQSKVKAAADLLQKQTSHQASQKAITEARPLLAAANALDGKISTGQAQLSTFNSLLTDATAASRLIEDAKKQLAEKLLLHKASQDRALLWIEQRKARSKVADSPELITSKLEEASAALQSTSTQQAQINSFNQQLIDNQHSQQQLNNEVKKTEDNYLKNKQALLQIQKDLAKTGSAELDQLLEVAQNNERTLEREQSYFEKYDFSRHDYDNAQQKEAENTKQLAGLKDQLIKQEPELSALRIKVGATRELINKAALRHTENIEQLRADLSTGEPCPVCGSLEHPYQLDKDLSIHADLADQLLISLHEELDIINRQYEDAGKAVSNIESELRFREKQAPDLKNITQNKSIVFKNAAAQWTAAVHFDSLHAKTSEQITGWFQSEKNSSAQQLIELRRQKEHSRALEQQAATLQQTITAEKEALQSIKDQLTQLQGSEQLITAKRQSSQSVLQESADKLQGIQTELQGYFPTPDWFNNWQTSPAAFIQTIQQFSTDWKARQKEAESLSIQIAQIDLQITSQDSQLLMAQKKLEQQQQIASQQSELVNNLLLERSKLFEGRAVNEVEEELQQSATAASQAVDTARFQLDELNKDWTATNLDKGILQNQLEQYQTQIQVLDKKITDWIQTHNKTQAAAKEEQITADPLTATLDREQVTELLSLPDSWIEQTKDSIKRTDQDLQDAKSRLRQREKDLAEHLTTIINSRSLEELMAVQTSQQAALNELQTSLIQRVLTLENDQKSQQKLGKFQKELEAQQKIFDSWAALNGLIGSKEGRKFREIAQQYTLDLLLRYANQHLNVLSKRYVLARIQDSLGIQVIDQDMADEIRSVYSLSGGESFLVSLALALGLASLSSNRLKVESLFIDEGFGSLDPATLSIAMDALERLQDQGRKVGVISHVQEMTERISVQIKVHKKSSGKSNITVESLF